MFWLILELRQQYPIAITVIALISLIFAAVVYALWHVGSPADSDDKTTSTDPGNTTKTVQEGHGRNIHSQIPSVCIIDSVVVDATLRHPRKEEEVRNPVPIKEGNGFDSFIRDYVIPTFCLQRRDKQFAVLFLSKYDKCNIHKTQFGESSYIVRYINVLLLVYLLPST
jgi:hypothetical protein